MEVADEQQGRLLAVDSTATSLIVGNLEATVTEEELVKRFQLYGPLASCHVILDKISQKSLGYAYVNYEKAWHAALALQVLDGCTMKGQPLRVAIQPKGPKINALEGNLFINHLDPSITSEQLHMMFSTCGALISARVATLDNGISKGYGYVRFVSEEDAQMAIQVFHGSVINENKISVTQFVPRSERQFVAYIPDLDEKKRNFVIDFNLSVMLHLFKLPLSVVNIVSQLFGFFPLFM
ncbi:uncharacterized protein LOC131036356 [Cryptomeria japonica]|uniref:uncharacterized protein LOC131036356 n=1 Tax=Cryptomeria japonica TaxID=3369 RepID=UPI0027D9FB25|nr:uncharacterized protein LOC131036356 [Cryptomeria japonica]